jgi:uncharacterized protein (TIGR03435 family)
METQDEVMLRRGRKLSVWAAGIAMAVVGTALLFGQTQAAKPLAFEIASVKMSVIENNHPQGFRLPSTVIRRISGNRFTESHITLTELIMQAYAVKDYQIFGLPGWGEWRGDQFDVVAKAAGSGTPSTSQVRLMLQTLLAERFHLKLHRAVKELPVYELVVGRNGPKLKQVPNDTKPLTEKRQSLPTIRMPLQTLVTIIAMHLDRPVIDKTGLAGNIYEFQFDQVALANCGQGDEALGCVSQMVQEQLGLKLNSRKDSAEALMIDQVEKPTGN